MPKFAFLVEIDLEDTSEDYHEESDTSGFNPSRNDVKQYVREAIETWGGQMAPCNPFFPTNINRVLVR